MGETQIHLAREGEPLGVFTASDTRELLAAGFLRPTDDFWMAGQRDWRPLSALPPDIGRAESPTPKRARDALGDMAALLRGQAVRVTKVVSSLLERQGAKVAVAGTRLLEDSAPRFREQTLARLKALQRTADSALRDELLLRKLFSAIYDTLPKSVHRFVNEEQFVQFCLQRRNRLLSESPGA